jgi:hypothetical protein
MATISSRQSTLFGLRKWQQQYQPYSSADFSSYDYETLRAAFIEYLKRNHPEAHNDWIESSEYVSQLDVMAFLGQALAFRSDLNARENFIDTAERRDSVIKLANLVSYTPKRATTANGLVKITSISTTESIRDIAGRELANATVVWDDPANPSWLEQFNAILNASLVDDQRIGRSGGTKSILGVEHSQYSIQVPPSTVPAIPYSTEVDGTQMNFELVSSSISDGFVTEDRPFPTNKFNILYRNDKNGWSSANTGFFIQFKQGSLRSQDLRFVERTPNAVVPIPQPGINDTDTWLFRLVDGNVVDEGWRQVESVHAVSVLGDGPRKVFSVVSRSNDEVSYLFSDGVFGEIPVGEYRAYFRSGNSLSYNIEPNEMSDISVVMDYVSRRGVVERLTITFSLQTVCKTAQARENLSSIKNRAPARYYTQNRMVNGEDYTNFAYTLYNSVIKSSAVNRSSIGISRNHELIDPTSKYASTIVFGTDGGLFMTAEPEYYKFSTFNELDAALFMSNKLPAILSGEGSVQNYHRNYSRFPGSDSILGRFEWHQSTVSGSQSTGYFFTQNNSVAVSIPVGVASSNSSRYIDVGAHLRFESPEDYWFDKTNRLTKSNTGKRTLWVTVVGVEGDGHNYGNGNLSSGRGPITLSSFVPGAVLNEFGEVVTPGARLVEQRAIIAPFQSNIPASVVRQALQHIKAGMKFALRFDHTAIGDKWSITDLSTNLVSSRDLVIFRPGVDGTSYTVTSKAIQYRFASAGEVRFAKPSRQVYDARRGGTASDQVTLYACGSSRTVWAIQKAVENDGLSNDFELLVSSYNSYDGTVEWPDFFAEFAESGRWIPWDSDGWDSSAWDAEIGDNICSRDASIPESESTLFTWRPLTVGTSSRQLLPAGSVVYGSNTVDLSEIIYQYNPNQVFYAPGGLGILNFSRTGEYLTVTTDINHLLDVGDTVQIAESVANEYNGIVSNIIEKINDTSFKIKLPSDDGPSGSFGGRIINRFYQSTVTPGTVPPVLDLVDVTDQYSAFHGKNTLDFRYSHISDSSTRVDPGTTNIIDIYVVTAGYHRSYTQWLNDSTKTIVEPPPPSLDELKMTYGSLDQYKMVSDTVVVNSVSFKPVFGSKAEPNLRGTIKAVKNPNSTASSSQIRSAVLSALNRYFSIDNWSFGDTLYFSELSAYLHSELGSMISSIVLVPDKPGSRFGDLYQIRSAPHEIFVNGATADSIEVITGITENNLKSGTQK